MADIRVEGEPAAGQDLTRIPDRMRHIDEWSAGGLNFELWVDVHAGDGRLLAIPRGCVCAATIAEANEAFTVSWTGDLDRPESFLQEQAATAAAVYRGQR
ncbi:hypothetical protein [Glycomyces sp. YM15]|uniref:hypothetical protein n=1 Tax=Glycomyces sp. YM15 TaxID=2800446 RepID=UPI00196563C9|nr:hypothetical protein [Glycomyces sp. YM15]